MSDIACAKKTRGRPKQFDRDVALDRALDLFWRHGYEATSLADLVEVTGAKAPTLYAEFGNKEGLFCASVEHYLTKHTDYSHQLLQQDELPIAEVVERYARFFATLFTDADRPSGCFMICTSATLSSNSNAVGDMLREKHQQQEANLKLCFDRKVKQGELLGKTDTGLLAKYICTTIQGLSTQAREGATREDLFKLVDLLMVLWPRLSQVGTRV